MLKLNDLNLLSPLDLYDRHLCCDSSPQHLLAAGNTSLLHPPLVSHEKPNNSNTLASRKLRKYDKILILSLQRIEMT